MKKMLWLLLAVAMVLSFAACSGNGDSSSQPSSEGATSSQDTSSGTLPDIVSSMIEEMNPSSTQSTQSESGASSATNSDSSSK